MNAFCNTMNLFFIEAAHNKTAVLMGILLIIAGLSGFGLLKLYEKNK